MLSFNVPCYEPWVTFHACPVQTPGGAETVLHSLFPLLFSLLTLQPSLSLSLMLLRSLTTSIWSNLIMVISLSLPSSLFSGIQHRWTRSASWDGSYFAENQSSWWSPSATTWSFLVSLAGSSSFSPAVGTAQGPVLSSLPSSLRRCRSLNTTYVLMVPNGIFTALTFALNKQTNKYWITENIIWYLYFIQFDVISLCGCLIEIANLIRITQNFFIVPQALQTFFFPSIPHLSNWYHCLPYRILNHLQLLKSNI